MTNEVVRFVETKEEYATDPCFNQTIVIKAFNSSGNAEKELFREYLLAGEFMIKEFQLCIPMGYSSINAWILQYGVLVVVSLS